ncbi:zinc finger C2H2-like protein [Corynascus novoguineensis]|uniref:Zinc finger C2H2-like protein n=1 Tax=Corynascus novoguineensis TaxID=1126955 RepID=A0AAN7CYN9_9PEZI|nr:zinc finger C2H2-like protein [Corynascus novoguineensis]
MSTFPQHRAMHDAGPFTPAIQTGHHGSHAVHQQAAVSGPYVPCPYEDKVTKDGTTARMVLLFLRELLEQLSVEEQPQQSYGCPMTRCHRSFAAPLQVVQHLLSCPELPNGEFDCDKCSTSHSFPTNEKDWAQWMGWRSPQSMHIQRKRSLGSKMRDFALRKKDPSRKQNLAFEPHFKGASAVDSRPSTATSDAPSSIFTTKSFHQHVVFPGQTPAPNFSNVQKSVLPSGLPEVDASMFWPGFNAGASDLPSTVSSIALSSTMDENASERFSQNTSQSTLFTPGLDPYQDPVASPQDSDLSSPQQYMYPPQLSFNTGLTSPPGHAPTTSAMCLDESLPLSQNPVSSADLRSTSSSNNGWWRTKVEVETPRPTPPSSGPETGFPLQANMLGSLAQGVGSGLSSPTSPSTAASPYYPIQQPQTTQSMSRALSQESMHSGITPVFGSPIPEGGPGSVTPRAESHQPPAHQHNHQHGQPPAGAGSNKAEASVEDLVCDECQWKPRGVRENLKGYLRKHKNTHKGVRLACDVPGCVKTFSRLDNLKKHKKDKHGIEDAGGSASAKRVAGESAETRAEQEAALEAALEAKRPPTRESHMMPMSVPIVSEDYSMLWPALHF